MIGVINQEENEIDIFKEIVNLINISMIELVALYYGLKPVMSELINFDKFEDELQANLQEPTTPEYEQEKEAGDVEPAAAETSDELTF